MSVFFKFFASGKKDKSPTPQEAIQRLCEVEEMLIKKSDFLEKKIETQIDIAKKNGTRNKRVALKALKTKRKFEKQLQQIDGTLSTIEFQREALENASTNTEVLKVMKIAGDSLKSVHKEIDVEEVHRIMDDVAEQREISEEIIDAISNPLGFGGQDMDEDELMAELEELEQESLDEELLRVGGETETEDLPSVPTAEPAEFRPAKARQLVDEEEMKELEMWAS